LLKTFASLQCFLPHFFTKFVGVASPAAMFGHTPKVAPEFVCPVILIYYNAGSANHELQENISMTVHFCAYRTPKSHSDLFIYFSSVLLHMQHWTCPVMYYTIYSTCTEFQT
jgi:hypothetical protein